MNTTTRNLLFLLSTAPMTLAACPSGDDTKDDEVGDGDGDPSGDGDGDGDGDGEPTGDGDGEPTGDGDGEPTGDGDGEPTGDGDGEGNSVCTDYAELLGECYGDRYAEYSYEYCVESITYYSAISRECGDAFEATMVCLSGLTCDELDLDPSPCASTFENLATVCE